MKGAATHRQDGAADRRSMRSVENMKPCCEASGRVFTCQRIFRRQVLSVVVLMRALYKPGHDVERLARSE